jgi:hypothetical protein
MYIHVAKHLPAACMGSKKAFSFLILIPLIVYLVTLGAMSIFMPDTPLWLYAAIFAGAILQQLVLMPMVLADNKGYFARRLGINKALGVDDV